MQRITHVCALLALIATLDGMALANLPDAMPLRDAVSFLMGLVAVVTGGTVLAIGGASICDRLHARGIRNECL